MDEVEIEPSQLLGIQAAATPLRAQPAESAEMVSQLLYGETATLLQTQGSWLNIRRTVDQYEGWIDVNMAFELQEAPSSYSYVKSGGLLLADGSYFHLPTGAKIPDNQQIDWGWEGVPVPAPDLQLVSKQPFENVLEVANWFMHIPYLWGGVGGFGIDCSGFTQTVFGICGKRIPRDSSQQIKKGQEISFGEHQAGDLAFFGKSNPGKVSHVGMLRDKHSILHASGKVRIDSFTSEGIVHHNTGKLTHHLITIRRC